MRCFRRGLLTVAGLILSLSVAGCGSFDPTDWFSNKKPIPGERRAVFPEGVPGVPQGIPPELKRNEPPPADPALASVDGGSPAAAPQATAPAAAEEKPAAKPKPRVASRPKAQPKPKQARRPPPPRPSSEPAPTQVRVQPSKPQQAPAQTAQPAAQQPSSGDQSVWGPTPGQSQQTRARGASAPWPAPPPTQQRAPAPWPDPPSPGSFSR
jgi:hypothetical protein